MQIRCQCGLAKGVLQEGVAVTAALLALHCTTNHQGQEPHQLEIDEMPDGDVHIRISCLAPQCNGLMLERRAAKEYVSALAIVFHSAHEGHRLRLELDGQVLAETPTYA